jgi:hypothetical protein
MPRHRLRRKSAFSTSRYEFRSAGYVFPGEDENDQGGRFSFGDQGFGFVLLQGKLSFSF